MKVHPVTGGLIEDGIGSHPEHVQAARHCDEAEAAGNVEGADAWRKQLGLQTSVDREAAHRAAAEKQERDARAVPELQEKHEALHAFVTDLMERVAKLEAKNGRSV